LLPFSAGHFGNWPLVVVGTMMMSLQKDGVNEMLVDFLELCDGLFPESMAYQEYHIDLSVVNSVGVFEKDGVYHVTFHNIGIPAKDLESAQTICARLLDALEIHNDREKIERQQIMERQNKQLVKLMKALLEGK